MPDLEQAKLTTQVFADRLRELSDSRGSYSQISRDLGINRQQFARYLNGTSRPRDALVRKMAEYFDVDPGVFFQQHATAVPGSDLAVIEDPIAMALLKGFSQFTKEPVNERDLPSGFYMQHKQSFTRPDKVACMLSKVFRNKAGVTYCKRRYSIRLAKHLPGVSVSHVSFGIFVKVHGALMLLESDAVAGDFVISAFNQASLYAVADRLQTGLILTHGRPSGIGPVAGRHMLERITDESTILTRAREQGFRSLEELPDFVQYYFEDREITPGGVLSLR